MNAKVVINTGNSSLWSRRASFVDRLPAAAVADRFGYSAAYVHLFRHQLTTGKIDFSEPVTEGKAARYRVTAETRRKIRAWREKELSAGEIVQMLSEEGADVSVRTVERVLAEGGVPQASRRTRLKIGLTVKGAEVPQKTQQASLSGRWRDNILAVNRWGPFCSPHFWRSFR